MKFNASLVLVSNFYVVILFWHDFVLKLIYINQGVSIANLEQMNQFSTVPIKVLAAI